MPIHNTGKTSVVDSDPHSFGCPGSGSGSRSMGIETKIYRPKFTNEPGFLPFKKAFVPS
jgi:hypothetical protein